MAILSGLRVLEVGHYVAAPFCTRLLADLGADVIKIEPLSGDPVRKWGEQVDGHSLWWSIHGRNKRSLTLDLKKSAAREIALELVEHTDVVVENFRPGQLDRLGMGKSELLKRNPDLVVAHISGYGQTGPYRDRAAFGVIAEAIGGLRHLTNNEPGLSDKPPVRVGVSIGDSIAGLYAAFGILAALWRRDKGVSHTVDVALTESVMSMMEAMLPEYGKLGKIKQPTGGRIATAAPSNAYPTRDGAWVLIAANSEPLFRSLCNVLNCPDLASDPLYIDNPSRVKNVVQLDRIISEWTQKHDSTELIATLEAEQIPVSKVYKADDIAADPQFRSRDMVIEVDDPLVGPVLHAGIVPHFPDCPGEIRWPGPSIGQHTDEILRSLLGLGEDAITDLRSAGAIA